MKYDFVCVSETFLYSSFESNDKNLKIKGYSLTRSDHPSNTKRISVCIYYKESLALRFVNITSLTECLICKVTIQNEKGYVAVVYKSLSQSTLNPFCLVWRIYLLIHFAQNSSLL